MSYQIASVREYSHRIRALCQRKSSQVVQYITAAVPNSLRKIAAWPSPNGQAQAFVSQPKRPVFQEANAAS